MLFIVLDEALHMAARKKDVRKEILMLKQKNAVAESFGYFFNEAGEVVYKDSSYRTAVEGLAERADHFRNRGR